LDVAFNAAAFFEGRGEELNPLPPSDAVRKQKIQRNFSVQEWYTI